MMGTNNRSSVMLTDYDGVIISSEFAKSAGWFISALYSRGDLDAGLISGLSNKEEEAVHSVVDICCQRKDEFEMIRKLSGLSRKQTRDVIWEMAISKYPNSLDKDKFEKIRADIKDGLIEQLSEPIQGTIQFFHKAWDSGIRIGLVTQTTSKDLSRQVRKFKLPAYIFSSILAVGDYSWDSSISKAAGYAITVEKMGALPQDVFAFEDSKSGLEEALKVGIHCIGVRGKDSNQDLSKADHVLSYEQMGKLACDDVIRAYKNRTPEEFVKYISDFFAETAAA